MRELVDSFFEERTLVNHHIASYNHFIEHRLQSIIDHVYIGEGEPVGGMIQTDIEGLKIKLGKLRIEIPKIREADGSIYEIYPVDCRLRDLSYSGSLILDFQIIEDGGEKSIEEIEIGRLPIMIGAGIYNLKRENIEKEFKRDGELRKRLSHNKKFEKLLEKGKNENILIKKDEYEDILRTFGEDPLDPGGYFIIDGNERVLISLEDLAPNRVLVNKEKKYSSITESAKVFSEHEGYRALITIEKKSDGTMVASLPTMSGKISAIVLLKALGLESDEEIMNNIVSDPIMKRFILACIEDCTVNYNVLTTEDAIKYVGKRIAGGQAKEYRLSRTDQLLDRYVLPHLGTTGDKRLKKAIFLARMCQSILELSIGLRKEDDRDNYANKRLRLSGDLMEDIFRIAFTNLLKDLKYEVERAHSRRRQLKISVCIKPELLTQKINRALATGNWAGERTGVSQMLDRNSNMSAIGHLRRIMSPLVRTQPHFEARDLHPTHWGRLCPNETPEGPNCGLIKNLALCVEISEGMNENIVVQPLKAVGLKEVKKDAIGSRVYLNGDLIGLHEDPEGLVQKLRNLRRKQNGIFGEVNVKLDPISSDVVINCDSGRVRRPLIVLENGKHAFTKQNLEKIRHGKIRWSEIIKNGWVEYLDAEEEENSFIALSKEKINGEHTHLELDSMAILSRLFNDTISRI